MPTSPTSRRRPCSERTTTASDAPEQPRLRGDLARPRLAREDVVGGEDERAAGEQPLVDLPDGEPLEVHDVGGGGGAAVREHVGDVRREARQAAQGPPGAPAVRR